MQNNDIKIILIDVVNFRLLLLNLLTMNVIYFFFFTTATSSTSQILITQSNLSPMMVFYWSLKTQKS
jgi:hypothetical protein